jgi:methyl-accepting chemotaxis protein
LKLLDLHQTLRTHSTSKSDSDEACEDELSTLVLSELQDLLADLNNSQQSLKQIKQDL